MRYPVLAATAFIVGLSMLAAPVGAQNAPKTAWGQPDLQGVWDFRTITPLERPQSLGEQTFLTEEEAANLEQEVVDRNAALAVRSARRTEVTESVDRGEEGAPGFYNNFWLDRGTNTVGTRRTSLVVNRPPPHNGRRVSDALTRETTHLIHGKTGAPTTAAFWDSMPVLRSRRAGTTRICRSSKPPTTWHW